MICRHFLSFTHVDFCLHTSKQDFVQYGFLILFPPLSVISGIFFFLLRFSQKKRFKGIVKLLCLQSLLFFLNFILLEMICYPCTLANKICCCDIISRYGWGTIEMLISINATVQFSVVCLVIADMMYCNLFLIKKLV